MEVIRTTHAEPHDRIDNPAFRVNFWEKPPKPAWATGEMAWSLDSYVLTKAVDMFEVLRWAEEHANGRRYEIFAETESAPETDSDSEAGREDRPRTSPLIRLVGQDPNDGVPTTFASFIPSSL